MYLLTLLLFVFKAEAHITDIVECSEQLLNRYFNQSKLALYYHSNLEVPNINFATPKIILGENQMIKFPLRHFRKFDSYVIVAKEDNIQTILDGLYRMYEWNSRSIFLFVYNGSINNLFVKLPKYFIYEVVALDINDLQLYTYYPYKYENFNEPHTKAYILGNCSKLEIFRGLHKIPKTWRNSTVRVSYMLLEPFVICAKCGTGLEVRVVHLMCDYMKYEVQFSDVLFDDWGHAYPNGTHDGAIGDAQKGIADFVIGHFHIREEESLFDFDFTFSYTDDDVVWAVPKAGFNSHWYNMMHIFTGQIWLYFCASMVAAVIFWYFIARKAHNEDDYYKNIANCIEIVVVNILGLPVLHEPRTDSMRVLFLTISIFCFIIVTGWKAYLINSLTHESDAYQISTLEDIMESKLILGIYPELRLLYKEEQTPEGDWVYEHANPEECDASNACNDRMAFKRDMATIATVKMFTYLMRMNYRSPLGRDMIYVFKKPLMKDYTVQYYTKGHPTFPRVNEFLMWVRTSGFVDYLNDIQDHELELTQAKYALSHPNFEITVLGMQQVKGTFYCLIGGLGISVLLLIWEYLYHRYHTTIVNAR